MQRVRQVLEDRLHVDHLPEPRAVRRPSRRTPPAAPGPARSAPCASGRCTFTTTFSPFASVARCTWAIVPAASGCGSMWSNTSSHGTPSSCSITLDDLLLGERRHVVLQRRELLDVLRRQQVGPRRQDLSELRERRAELLERGAQPLALTLAADGALLVRPAEQLLQPVLGEDGGDLRAARDQVGLGLDVGGARAERRRLATGSGGHGGLPVRRVHDDHRASRVVADAVRHVARAGTPCGRPSRRCRPRARRCRAPRSPRRSPSPGRRGSRRAPRPRSPATWVAYVCSSSAAPRARVASAAPNSRVGRVRRAGSPGRCAGPRRNGPRTPPPMRTARSAVVERSVPTITRFTGPLIRTSPFVLMRASCPMEGVSDERGALPTSVGASTRFAGTRVR